ncbi:MAG: hypothetical protein Q4G02_04045 [bacterium]|nr:hypothetical protein [bacterium]
MLANTLNMTDLLKKKFIASQTATQRRDLPPASQFMLPESATEFWCRLKLGIRDVEKGKTISLATFLANLK